MITTPAAPPTVRADGLWKRFGSHVAVRDVSLSLDPGEVVGLVGPNGAGKTTTIRMLLDILPPDQGSVSVFGAPVSPQAQSRIGYLPEERGLYRSLRVIPNMLYLAELKGMRREQALRRADELFALLGLEPHRGKKVSELSRGLGQLVQFAATILHEPSFIVLDEPFSGLDPVNVRVMKDAVSRLRNEGAAIMFSTHQMTDVEELCDRVIMIDGGAVVLDGRARRHQAAVRGERSVRRRRTWTRRARTVCSCRGETARATRCGLPKAALRKTCCGRSWTAERR